MKTKKQNDSAWLDSAKWSVEHNDDRLSYIGIPDMVPRQFNSQRMRMLWLGPLPRPQAEWLADAIRRKQDALGTLHS